MLKIEAKKYKSLAIKSSDYFCTEAAETEDEMVHGEKEQRSRPHRHLQLTMLLDARRYMFTPRRRSAPPT